jgi:hypothetical protein
MQRHSDEGARIIDRLGFLDDEELRLGAGAQFCPRCVTALERLLQDELEAERVRAPALATAS